MKKIFLQFCWWDLNSRNSQKVNSKPERCERVYKRSVAFGEKEGTVERATVFYNK